MPCGEGSWKLRCKVQLWPAAKSVPVIKARLQAFQLMQGGCGKPSHFSWVISETACKQQDFTPAESPFCNNIADTPAFWNFVGLKHYFFSYNFCFTGWPGGFITNLLWRKKEQRQWTVNVRPLDRNTFPTSIVPSEKRRASLQRSLQQLSLKKYASLRTLLTATRATRATCCHIIHAVCLISTYRLGCICFGIVQNCATPPY